MPMTLGPVYNSETMLKNLATEASLSLFLIRMIFWREFGIKFGISPTRTAKFVASIA